MDEKQSLRAKEIIEKIIYLSLGTTGQNGNPWNSPVFFAFDEQYNFYWRSRKDAVHSQNIKINKAVFITIFDSTAAWGTGKGVYVKARAEELNTREEITYALALLDNRSPKKVGNTESFMNDFPRRIYKATPENFWMNVDLEIDGIFIDKRVEIKMI